MHRLAGARGHRVVVGTPEYIADEVLPILRRRGLFRRDYTGSTLREHYGLQRPSSQYARTATERVTA